LGGEGEHNPTTRNFIFAKVSLSLLPRNHFELWQKSLETALRGESLQGFGGFDFWAYIVLLHSLYCNLSIYNVYGLPISVNHNIQDLK
jgi:hypothetical protein